MSTRSTFRKAARELAEADAAAARAVAPKARSGARDAVTRVGKLGDQPELRTLSAMVIAGGLLGANRRLLRAGIRMLLAHELATLGKNLVKEQIDRTRPHSATSHDERAVKRGRRTAKTHTSFPSGHGAGSTAVARAVGREYPGVKAPALAAAAGVAAMQVPRLNHYPTDVAAGMALGLAAEAIAGAVLPKLDGDD